MGLGKSEAEKEINTVQISEALGEVIGIAKIVVQGADTVDPDNKILEECSMTVDLAEALGKTNHKEIESHRDIKAPGSITAPDNGSTLDMDRDFNILTSKNMKHHINSDVDFSSEALGKTNNKEIESHRDVKAPDRSLIAADNCSTMAIARDFNVLTSQHMDSTQKLEVSDILDEQTESIVTVIGSLFNVEMLKH